MCLSIIGITVGYLGGGFGTKERRK
jgi:hypothetical protein